MDIYRKLFNNIFSLLNPILIIPILIIPILNSPILIIIVI